MTQNLPAPTHPPILEGYVLKEGCVSDIEPGDYYVIDGDAEWVAVDDVDVENGDDIILTGEDGDVASFDRNVWVFYLRSKDEDY